MKSIAIYGFGGFGREVACLIKEINRISPTWEMIGFFDDGIEKGSTCKYGKVLGNMQTLNNWPTDIDVVFAIGNGKIVRSLYSKVTNLKISFPNLVAPNVFFFDKDDIAMGKGNILTFGCRISTGVHIGNFNIFNGCVSLGHDVSVGDFNVMFPETRISGMCNIGCDNFFGAKSFVAQDITIPNSVRIAAGAVLLNKPKSDCLYMGNPAKIVKI